MSRSVFSWNVIIVFLSLACLAGVAHATNVGTDKLFIQPDTSQTMRFVGKAYDLKTNELLYVEEHQVELSSDSHYANANVRYSAPNGEVMAKKVLDFSYGMFAPSLIFFDPRHDQQFQTENKDQGLALSVRSGNSVENSFIDHKADEPLVVDAGFDRFLVDNWDRLVLGDELKFQFLAPTQGTSIRFNLSRVDVNDQRVRFKIEPGSWLVRLLVDPIYLDYSVNFRRLVRYEGLTNIRQNESEDYYTAVITYRYDTLNDTATDELAQNYAEETEVEVEEEQDAGDEVGYASLDTMPQAPETEQKR